MSASQGGVPIPPFNSYQTSPQVPQRPVPEKTSKGVIALIVVLAVVLVLAMVASLFSLNKVSLPWNSQVAVITIDGTIGQDGGANDPEGFSALLKEAENDNSIKAVVLRVNSGGGLSAAGEEMASYARDFSKPLVVSTESTNASAAYLISSQADWIYANQSSSVGSIGALIQTYDYSELLDMLGINVTNITSSSGKDASYGDRPLTDEEIAYYQDMVDQINDYFISAVAEGRGMTESDVRALATGMIYTGKDCVENGLIDEIGSFEDACNKAAELAHISSYDVVYLDSDDGQLNDLLSLLSSSSSSQERTKLMIEGLTNNDSIS